MKDILQILMIMKWDRDWQTNETIEELLKKIEQDLERKI